MQPRISMISLGVLDLHASIEFYAQGLELRRMTPFNDEIAFFNLNDTWLSLYPWGNWQTTPKYLQRALGFAVWP